MAPRARPLSPHLQIYRLPLVALMSITHRATGVALSVGTLYLACWLGSLAYGPEAYEKMSRFAGSWIGLLLLFGWSVALYYHLSNGIRHLLWDIGKGFELPDARRANLYVLAATVILTVATWGVALAMRAH